MDISIRKRSQEANERERLTARAGFSVANFEALAASSFLRSGGINLSSQP